MQTNNLQWLTDQKLHVVALIVSTFAFLDAFFPLAEGEQVNASIIHLTGLPWLLYLLPLITLVIAVMALYRPIHSIPWWYMVVGGIGFLIGILAIAACRTTVNLFEGESSVTNAGALLPSFYITLASIGGAMKFLRGDEEVEQATDKFSVVFAPDSKHSDGFPALSPDFAVGEPESGNETASIATHPVSALAPPNNVAMSKPVAAVAGMTLEDALVFTNKDYYWKSWQPLIEGTPGSPGFNFCAFLFGIRWCFYRKLYVAGIIVFVVDILVTLSALFSLGVLLSILGILKAGEPFGTPYIALATVLGFFLVRLPFGLFANRLLFNLARMEIRKINAAGMTGEARDAAIKARGGVSILAMILAIVMCLASNIAAM